MPSKPAWLYNQSAVVPFRKFDDALELLLITSIRRKRWIIPKGVIEQHLAPHESAAKEALEEAGVEGHVPDRLLGRYQYDKWGGTCSVQVFLMQVQLVLDDWDEAHARTRKWVSLEEAVSLLSEPDLCKLLHQVPTAVDAWF